ncbi:MAG: response regulator receiver protein [Acidobacteriales bacterium]|nr:response regulator receiver protein [Terriglobales bacterium]
MSAQQKILIVDDNPGLRAVCSSLLASAGYLVTSAEDGFAGLLCLEKNIPDLILCDLHLPRMSGFEFLSVVRRRFPEVRVMAMSGAYVGDSNSGGILADAFYAKGQSPTTFLGTVQTLLQAFTPSRHTRELAEVWIPLNAKDSHGNPYVVATCPECFRTFPLTVSPLGSPDILNASCFFCAFHIKYKNDFPRPTIASEGAPMLEQPLTKAEVVEAAAIEASTGAFEDEIASQTPFI